MQLDDLIEFESDEDLILNDEVDVTDEPTPKIPEQDSNDEVIEDESSEESQVDDDATAYFEYLKSMNVLKVPDDFEFDGTVDGINNALELTTRATKQEAAMGIWDSLPDDFKPLLAYGLKGGKSLQEYLSAYQPLDYDEADLSDAITQERVIRDYYKEIKPNNTEERISNMITRLKDLGDLEEEAREAIDYMKELKAAKQQDFLSNLEKQQQAERERADQETQKLVALIESSKEHDSLRKNRLKNFITNPIKENGTVTTEFARTLNTILDNPEHVVQLANLLADYHNKSGLNFDRIKRQLKTENNKSFRAQLDEKLEGKTKLKGGTQREQREDFDFEEYFKR